MKDFFRHNGILILLAAVLLALVIAIVSTLTGGTADPLSNLAGVLTMPVRNAVSAIANWTEEKYSDAFEREQLKEENQQLKLRLSELEAQEREAQAALQENQRLRSLLRLRPSQRSFELESATVTAHTASNWESVLTISKGTSSGVEAGDCVVDEYWNLTGIVREVGENWAAVATIVDLDIELGGQLTATGDAAVLEGDFALMGEGRLKLSYLPEDCEPEIGDVVTTSGRGGVYPAGLVVGRVESVHTEASGMTHYAVIRPSAHLERLKQVFVIKDFDIVE